MMQGLNLITNQADATATPQTAAAALDSIIKSASRDTHFYPGPSKRGPFSRPDVPTPLSAGVAEGLYRHREQKKRRKK